MGDFLNRFVSDFASAMEKADRRRPQAHPYRPGIGPHTERRTVALVVNELGELRDEDCFDVRLEVRYPGDSREKCDLQVAVPNSLWSIEVKMVRLRGDNGKPADQALMHLLSPYPEDRSALTDCAKLLQSEFGGRLAILVYGYDFDDRSLDPAIDAFEVLAGANFVMGRRHTAHFDDLIHPVHQRGRVFAWELLRGEGRTGNSNEGTSDRHLRSQHH